MTSFFSKIRRRLHDHQPFVEAKVSTDTSSVQKLAQSSQDQILRAIPATSSDQKGNAKTSIPVADRPNDTSLPALYSQNNRDLELVKFRQDIDKWKKWKHNHLDHNWIRTAKDLVDEISPFLEMLPDGMIPIRGLVKSLFYACKKGAEFALAKEEVFLFVQEIDQWLDVVYYASEGKNGHVGEVWEFLDEIRQLIDEALHWSLGLQATRWLSGISVQSQIQTYREEFSKISLRFGVVSDIKLLKAVDGVAQDVKNISENNDTAKRLELLKKQLEPRLIENESYNDQEKHPCDPETRLEILQEINSWIKDVSESSQCFYWLSGAPGIGKSAITASIAKMCREFGILGAQFFINRNDATTTDPCALFPTICWRLCERFPRTVAVVMEEILRAHPTLVDDISEVQTLKLFVKAINVAAATDLSQAVVIVIDALDETDTKRLRDLAQIFSKVVADLPRNAKLFISSRAEDAITKPFNSLCSHKRVKSRYVGAEHSITDVSRFMKKEIKKILEDNEMDWGVWGDDAMMALSSQASGLFIWAQTALNFLRDEIQHNGQACFAGLLDVLKMDGMNDINMLYLTILRRTCKDNDWEYERFHRIIGAILVRQTPLSISDIAQLLDLKEPRNSQPVDLVHFVRQYRTVLVNDTRDIKDGVVPRLHKSFADFITSERAKEFRVDKSASHGELALRCMEQLNHLTNYLKSNKKTPSFPAQLAYASVHWQTHLTRMVKPDGEEQNAYDMPDIHENETQSLPANSRSKKGFNLGPVEIERMASDVAVAFSPDGTQFASASKGAIQLRDARTGSVTMSLVGHKDNVMSIGFSPDGRQLVSASLDKTARIWDTRTGKVLHVLRGAINYAAFSHDGRIVVTCSNGTTCTWNSRTGRQLNRFDNHTVSSWYCVFSQNDQRIASYSGSDIMVWDVNSGNLISKFKHKGCDMILFCPCGGHLVSCDRCGEVKLWDAESGNGLDWHTNSTISPLAFSDQGSASNYIHVPPSVPQNHVTPYIYSLKTEYGDLCGIVEHQGIWISTIDERRLKLFFAAGATKIE